MKLMKWPGSKAKASSFVGPRALPYLQHHTDYVVPFWGSGALSKYLYLQNGLSGKKVWANDYNPYIVNLWRVVKDPKLASQTISILQAMDQEYGSLRTAGQWLYKPTKRNPDRKRYHAPDYEAKWLILRHQLNQKRAPGSLPEPSPEYAAKFVFFNRTCFNGLWRESEKSGLNVPIGRTGSGNYMTYPDWESVIESGSWVRDLDIEFHNEGYLTFLEGVPKRPCLVYADPPYYKTFTQYNSKGFSIDDQADLSLALSEFAAETRSDVIVSNSAAASLFYPPGIGWEHHFFDSKTSVSCSSNKEDMSEILAFLSKRV